MENQFERSLSFTPFAEREMMEIVEDLSFPAQDAKMIFQALQRRLRIVPFCDYLKRYVYLETGMTAPFRSVSLMDYQITIMDAFRDTGTPCSFHRGSSHLATRVRDWLTQESIQRHAVLLLGFGLSMSVEEVNRFLTHACHDHHLDSDDPLEGICLYCYDHGYGFAKMEQLLEIYTRAAAGEDAKLLLRESQPVGRMESESVIETDGKLIQKLMEKSVKFGGVTPMLRSTRESFRNLYYQAQRVICTCRPGDYRAPEDVTPYDFELILCAPIPRTRHGNLVSHLTSSLRKEMSRHRFSRQHLYQLLKELQEPTRYDLIILSFLISLEGQVPGEDPQIRYRAFVENTNRVLTACGFSTLYTADPWECFIMMCMLSSDPLGTYSDVNEMTYTERAEGEKDG